MVCKSCTECLRQRCNDKKTSLKFGLPMVWREPKNYVSDCYFCTIDVTGINRKNRKVLKYPDFESARRPVAHSDECPVPVFVMLSDDSDSGSTPAQESQEDETDLAMIVHILFHKMSLMILFVILICQSPHLSSWHPDQREKNFCLMALASRFIATDIKSFFIFSWKKKIWFTAQILFIFCNSMECHIMNPEIADYLSTAARDHLNVFCFIMAISLLRYVLLTRLH